MAMPPAPARPAPDFDEANSLLPSELLGPDQYAGPNSSLPWSDSHFPASCFSSLDFDFFKHMLWFLFCVVSVKVVDPVLGDQG